MGGRRVIAGAVAALAALALAGLPAAAPARPGDKPIELFVPGDGAIVKDSSHGLEVDFTCPDYYDTDLNFAVGPEGYTVILSTSGAVDDRGVLVAMGRLDTRTASPMPERAGHCSAADDDTGDALMPTEPGTYFWQVTRTCAGYVCHGAIEASEVAQFTVQRTICTVTRSELKKARAAQAQAQAAFKAKRTSGRRARVLRLNERVVELGQRLYARSCKGA